MRRCRFFLFSPFPSSHLLLFSFSSTHTFSLSVSLSLSLSLSLSITSKIIDTKNTSSGGARRRCSGRHGAVMCRRHPQRYRDGRRPKSAVGRPRHKREGAASKNGQICGPRLQIRGCIRGIKPREHLQQCSFFVFSLVIVCSCCWFCSFSRLLKKHDRKRQKTGRTRGYHQDFSIAPARLYQ